MDDDDEEDLHSWCSDEEADDELEDSDGVASEDSGSDRPRTASAAQQAQREAVREASRAAAERERGERSANGVSD
jgi:hypothetical protein